MIRGVLAMASAVITCCAVAGVLGVSLGAAAAGAGLGQMPVRPVTFADDVAPFVSQHCTTCHRPEGSAPFSLTTYAEARAHAADMAAAIASRHMPPWKPEPGAGEFLGNRRLGDAEMSVVARWIADGATEGRPGVEATAPVSSSEWRLGPPDLILTMPAYTLHAGGDDVYRQFVLPVPGGGQRYVKAWEFRPGNLRVVHHATMEIDPTGVSRHMDDTDHDPGYEGLVAHTSMAPDGYFLDWAPGHSPAVFPDGMAFPIPPRSDLVLMMHMRPTAKAETVQATIGLYFADTPPVRVPALLRLTRQDVDIAADASNHVVESRVTLPVPVDLYTVQPHAHNLARSIESLATLPDGRIIPLLRIADWDFNWQDVYRYAKPMSLPAGTTISMRWVYDNTAANRVNPHHPPQRVTFGQRTTDEMAELWFQVVPRSQADRAVLAARLGPDLVRQTISGYEMMLHADPANVALHNDVALLYTRLADVTGAVAHFRAVTELTPGSAAARYNLGSALWSQGQRAAARAAFEAALQQDGQYGNALRSLGIVLQTEGRLSEAAGYYRRAIAAVADDAVAHHNLGMVLHAQRAYAEAAAEYRQALHHDDGYVDALTDLAWLLVTVDDPSVSNPAEGLTLAQRAAALTSPQTATVLDVLAAALAASARFDEAVGRSEQALRLARAARDEPLASAIEGRLTLYRQQQPFRSAR